MKASGTMKYISYMGFLHFSFSILFYVTTNLWLLACEHPFPVISGSDGYTQRHKPHNENAEPRPCEWNVGEKGNGQSPNMPIKETKTKRNLLCPVTSWILKDFSSLPVSVSRDPADQEFIWATLHVTMFPGFKNCTLLSHAMRHALGWTFWRPHQNTLLTLNKCLPQIPKMGKHVSWCFMIPSKHLHNLHRSWGLFQHLPLRHTSWRLASQCLVWSCCLSRCPRARGGVAYRQLSLMQRNVPGSNFLWYASYPHKIAHGTEMRTKPYIFFLQTKKLDFFSVGIPTPNSQSMPWMEPKLVPLVPGSFKQCKAHLLVLILVLVLLCLDTPMYTLKLTGSQLKTRALKTTIYK